VLTRAEEKLIVALRRRKERAERRLFLAEGARVVQELIDADLRPRLAVVSAGFAGSEPGDAIVGRLAPRCPVRRVDDHRLQSLAATEAAQGVLVVAEIPAWTLESVEVPATAQVLILDAVQDPGNVGTLVRTAAAFGAVAAVALPGTADFWNPKTVRSAAGASFRMPVVSAGFDELSPWLEQHGVILYAADSDGIDVESCDFAGRSALAVGNEGAGLSPEIVAGAAAAVAVPMSGPVESLNVAVATGILLYLMTRRRR